MTIFQVDNLSLRRGTASVLQEVSFTVIPGETLTIIGPSGAGKSSLLRCLNRLLEPHAGQILFHGQDIRALDVTELRCRVGFVFQKTAVFAGSVADNIAFGPMLKNQTLSRERLRTLMKMVALDDAFLDKDAGELSGGQEQRMAIARALANEPEVMLLDEPTSALDPIATHQVEDTLQALRRDLNLTLIWVSHAVEQARRISDRVLLLGDGRVIRIDTVEAVLDPKTGDRRALAFANGHESDSVEG
jgi:putative ABC transport system ATP-binding protein